MAEMLQITRTRKHTTGKASSYTTVILADQIASFEYRPSVISLSVYMKSGQTHDFTSLTKEQGDDLYALLMGSQHDLGHKAVSFDIKTGF
ncbi:hypothetical protein [Stenotrophomonas bentonitica]|uniref:hypothetical protein n=1 Tax=Stenotrophomonas bentonitica TaxID=1450134 RepID=UPI000C9BBDCD|nr:hypothetical protein [Stenotrophomonas bentonitica]